MFTHALFGALIFMLAWQGLPIVQSSGSTLRKVGTKDIPKGYRQATCTEAKTYQSDLGCLLVPSDICSVAGGTVRLDKSNPASKTAVVKVETMPWNKRSCTFVTKLPKTGTFYIENAVTRRWVADNSTRIVNVSSRGSNGGEGGWLNPSAPAPYSVDANYDGRALWKIESLVGYPGWYLIMNAVTHRYLFDGGKELNLTKNRRGAEGGWRSASISDTSFTTDQNYYNLAPWRFSKAGEGRFLIINGQSQRYLMDAGKVVKKRGQEKGWLHAPKLFTVDARYDDRVTWEICGLKPHMFNVPDK